MSLSLWRFNKTNNAFLAFFIAAASINSVYCSIWDLMMDWSMPLDPRSDPPLLRHVLAYKKHKWWYYLAMALDPILRLNWIFYVIYRHDAQHSSLVSFLVSLAEVGRRGIWVLFRVENEHCTNVGRFRASRDPALPYAVEDHTERAINVDGAAAVAASPPQDGRVRRPEETAEDERRPSTTTTTGLDIERGPPSAAESLRRRRRDAALAAESPISRALKRAGTTMLAAHSQDYERKRRPVDEGRKEEEEDDDDDTDEDADDNTAGSDGGGR